jgi:Formyl transferase
MAVKNIKIVIWCGAAANQKALANKIAEKYKIAGIVIDTPSGANKKKRPVDLPAILLDRLRFRKIYGAWKSLMNYYDQKFPQWPDTPTIKVGSINNTATETFTSNLQPDLIIVSGTALIKEPLLSIAAPLGIINLHTGLSPFVKGGPNCTNWCIANNTLHLVGNTIMWLNAGIDTGNIITTETVDIKKAADLDTAHRLVMEQAHDLYIRAIDYLSTSEPPYNSVPQNSISKGELFLTKMWTSAKKKQLLKNWKERDSFDTAVIPKTVSLKAGKNS